MLKNIFTARNHEVKSKNLAIKNIIWLNIGQIISYINTLILSTWIIRHFGPLEYGKYGYALTIVNTIGIFVGLGISKPFIRELIVEKESRNKLIESCTFIYLVTGILGYLATIYLACINTNRDISILLAVAGTSLLLKTTDVYINLFQLDLMVQKFVRAKSIGLLVGTAIKIGSIYQNMPIISIAFADIVGLVIAVSVMEYQHKIIRRLFNTNSGIKNIVRSARMLTRKGLPLLIATTVVPLNMKIDTILINQLMGVEKVGIYMAAIKIPLLITPLLATIDQAILPISIEKVKNKESIIYVLNKANSFIIYATLGISLIFSTGSEIVINKIFGMDYRESTNVLAIIIFIILIGSIVKLHTQYCILSNKSNCIFFRQIFVLALNYGLNILLIPRLGLLGAASGTLIATTLGILSFISIDRVFRKILFTTICKPDFEYSKLILRKINQIMN